LQSRIEHHLHLAAVVLAEELNLERAAQRLQIPLTELSSRITTLECKLSLKLFERHSNDVTVTVTEDGAHYIELLRKSRLLQIDAETE
jgi:DNA-binding transcriptional LysR family regulator